MGRYTCFQLKPYHTGEHVLSNVSDLMGDADEMTFWVSSACLLSSLWTEPYSDWPWVFNRNLMPAFSTDCRCDLCQPPSQVIIYVDHCFLHFISILNRVEHYTESSWGVSLRETRMGISVISPVVFPVPVSLLGKQAKEIVYPVTLEEMLQCPPIPQYLFRACDKPLLGVMKQQYQSWSGEQQTMEVGMVDPLKKMKVIERDPTGHLLRENEQGRCDTEIQVLGRKLV